MPKTNPQIKNPHLPLIQPYTKRNDRNVRRWRIKQRNPVNISKCNLKRILAEIDEDDSKPNHRLVTQYGASAEMALTMCKLPSSELLIFQPSSILLHSASTLLHQLRKSLLNHDWNFSSHLLQVLIQSKLINKRLLIYVIRSSLIILLNNRQHPEILEEFLTLVLGFNVESKMNDFLNSIFQFPTQMKTPNSIIPREEKTCKLKKEKKKRNLLKQKKNISSKVKKHTKSSDKNEKLITESI